MFLTWFVYNSNDSEKVKQEILESLKPHNELIVIDSSNTLRLKQRHKELKLTNYSNIKGHLLSERTMQIAVPAINIAIYMNPTLTFLAKTALVTATIGEGGTQIGADQDITINS